MSHTCTLEYIPMYPEFESPPECAACVEEAAHAEPCAHGGIPGTACRECLEEEAAEEAARSFWHDLRGCDGSQCAGCADCQPVLWQLVTGDSAGEDDDA